MSHFVVLVIGEDVEGQLAPYDENIRYEPYVKATKEQLIEEGRKEIEDYKNGLYAEYLKDPKAYEENSNDQHFKYISEDFPQKLEWDDEQIYQDQIRWCEPEDLTEDGGMLSTYNPKSKWDWYQVGGRWPDLLKLKAGAEGKRADKSLLIEDKSRVEGHADMANFGDIDWDGMRNNPDEFLRAKREWELIVEGAQPENDDERDTVKYSFYKPSYYTGKYPDKETYAAAQAEFTTYAVLKNGQWFGKGEMGMFGMSSDSGDDELNWTKNYWEAFLADCEDDTPITVVDCHI